MNEDKSEYIKQLSEKQMRENQALIQQSINLNNAARVYDQKGDYWKAADFYQQCVQLKIKQYGEKSEKVAIPLLNLGKQYKKMNQPKQAKIYFQRVKDIWKNIFEKTHQNMKLIQQLLDEPDFPEKDQIRDQHKACSLFNFDPNQKMEGRDPQKL